MATNKAMNYEMEIKTLQDEMKNCIDHVLLLVKEFSQFKKVVEATQIEVNITRVAITELTNKLQED